MVTTIQHEFAQNLNRIFGNSFPSKLGIALSGGVDSVALTTLLHQWAQPRNILLTAYIIDHKLRPESTTEAIDVKSYMERRFNIPVSIHKLDAPNRVLSNTEEWARHERRNKFAEACKNDKINHLMMAHHWDDQRELFIQRLLSGSQWTGLAGMSPVSHLYTILPLGTPDIFICRPCLNFRKQDLIRFCKEQKLRWWTDPTNFDPLYTSRNLIRRYLENDHELPNFIKIDNLTPFLRFLGTQRDHVKEISNRMYQKLIETDSLTISNSSAYLTLNPEIISLPPAILAKLLFQISAPISPLANETVAQGSHKLKLIVKSLQTMPENFTKNVLGVNFELNKNVLKISREVPRKSELRQVQSFTSTNTWCKWHLIDNRWYIRWKHDNPETKQLEVKFLKSPLSVTQVFKKDALAYAKIVNSGSLHPAFFWKESGKIIGFPTLGVLRDITTEIINKRCVF